MVTTIVDFHDMIQNMFRLAVEIICNFVYYCVFCAPNMSGDLRRATGGSHTWRKA